MSRFWPFFPKPVTDYSIMYTVMLNIVKIENQPDQKILPVYCDEFAFRILTEIFLERQNQFKALIPTLASFHKAKCFKHCIRKYIWETGIDHCLFQTKVAGVKAMKSMLDGTNYGRPL